MPLNRFVDAQETDGAYESALRELSAGAKKTHWMWFVFPQIAGLGRSEQAARYALISLEEAREYAAHEVLGARLRECCDAVAELSTRDATEVFGEIDALKFRSSLTLFARAVPAEPRFQRLLNEYFEGAPDELTDQLLREAASGDD